MPRPTLLDEIRAALGSAPAHPASRAVLAALREHGDTGGYCETCAGDEQYDGHDEPVGVKKLPWPCPTTQGIADELGVTGARVAAEALIVFVDDLRAAGHPPLATVRRLDYDWGPGGPYGVDVVFEWVAVPVMIPGLPVERLRYVPGLSSLADGFQQLYVDGGSWLWPFALDMCATIGCGKSEADD